MADADLGSRIEGIRQLGSVVRAMTGIAGARARTARAQIAAVDSFADTLKGAWRQAMSDRPDIAFEPATRPARIVFCAEQGFVGAFSERVLDEVEGDLVGADVFLIGSRGVGVAAARGITPVWSAAMPSRSASLPKFADRVMGAVFADGAGRSVEAVYPVWQHGQVLVTRLALFPLEAPEDAALLPPPPLTNLPLADLAVSLGLDLIHADLTHAALHAFVAENEARVAAMSAASREIEEELGILEALVRRIRQEVITAEIIEISAGAMMGAG